ncbi:transcription termination/antitermination NusG family protein [uncultured Kiloniella sp.]|uniref:transcription termination/antitermination protein NusG n=1 Tax=uncultured Kiloniella sp. TaxID=1133091 RepID=UPI00261C0574|nr:transcription termination/antitermination NusG family protein [uncultured Kiloniella sp.]
MKHDKGRWIVANTKANLELFAVEQIKQQGFDAYCPVFEATVRHARKTTLRQKPLFPSYIFIRLTDLATGWRSLMSTRGVKTLLTQGGKLSVLPEGFVSNLYENEQRGELLHLAQPGFSRDDEVEIKSGIFDGLTARVLGAPEKERIWLLLDILGRKVRVSQDVAKVALA